MDNQTVIRLAVFAGVFAIMAVIEALWPRKKRTEPRLTRWFTNIGIVVLDSIAVRIVFAFVFPLVAVGFAALAEKNGWGLMNLVSMPFWLKVVLSAVLLDMAIYWQHVISHKVPVFWKIHRMHHADRDIDVSTGNRFHPFEIILSMFYKFAVIFILGPAPLGVFVFEVLLNGSAMFNHANAALPLWLDRILRVLFVTPDMHRVHHSVHRDETDSNYGFNLAIWDRLFGTYISQPRDGHDRMVIGLPQYQDDKPSNIVWSLLLPFRK